LYNRISKQYDLFASSWSEISKQDFKQATDNNVALYTKKTIEGLDAGGGQGQTTSSQQFRIGASTTRIGGETVTALTGIKAPNEYLEQQVLNDLQQAMADERCRSQGDRCWWMLSRGQIRMGRVEWSQAVQAFEGETDPNVKIYRRSGDPNGSVSDVQRALMGKR